MEKMRATERVREAAAILLAQAAGTTDVAVGTLLLEISDWIDVSFAIPVNVITFTNGVADAVLRDAASTQDQLAGNTSPLGE